MACTELQEEVVSTWGCIVSQINWLYFAKIKSKAFLRPLVNKACGAYTGMFSVRVRLMSV